MIKTTRGRSCPLKPSKFLGLGGCLVKVHVTRSSDVMTRSRLRDHMKDL